VQEVCGITPEAFREVADTLVANSGRERTTMLAYAVGWTQHSTGVQIIRTGAILQLLLGNIGRPGGGIMAMRGHASIQGSSDIPTLYDLLPGYLHMPRAKSGENTLHDYIASGGNDRGWWSHFDNYIVSLLKAWFGDAATEENDYGFRHLPKITGNHAHYPTMMRAVDGGLHGMFVMGQNPAIGSQNGGLMRRALRNMKWLVVRDLAEIETANFWKDAPEIQSGEVRPEDIETEVFLMPCASHVEKEGTFTNTQRLVQWRDKALEPPGDARSELWFIHHLTKRVRAHYAGSTEPKDWPIQNLHWDYEEHGHEQEPLSEDILREINGYEVATGAPVPGFAQLKGPAGAGSTPGSSRTASTSPADGTRATSASPAARSPPSGAGPGRRTGGCSTTAPRPTPRAARGASARSTSGGTRSRASGRATTSPTSPSTSARTTALPTRAARGWTPSPGPTPSS
jgi:formate dehydrogenase major subunit